jgi:hypothetical protein
LGNKSFVFPDAFKSYLTLEDEMSNNLVREMLQKKQKERNIEEAKLEKIKVLELEEEQRILNMKTHLKNLKIHPSSQAAFSCEPQDLNNIFTHWKVFVGVVKKGKNEGQPNKPIRINLNSACLLTKMDDNMSEKDRRIVGLYMVNENFIGKLCEDGFIPAHSNYRLRLSEEESEKMFFWNYYINEKYPNNMTWNSKKLRYFENICMAQILKDIFLMKSDPTEKLLAQNFFEYFCEINHIDKKELQNPNGALIHSKS